MNSSVRKRFFKLPGQSEIAQSTAKTSSHVRSEPVIVSAVQHLIAEGIGL
jgi:hypothetical protein